MNEEEFDQKVEEWHEGDSELPLHEFLGLTKDAQRYRWLKSNMQEKLTPESLSTSEYAPHKTMYVLPLMISWADFCGQISFDRAVDILMEKDIEQ